MKSINVDEQEFVGCHVLTKVTYGNHVPFTTKKTYTLVNTRGESLEVSPMLWESVVVGSGIRKYSGTLETGGGRHNFYGTDLETALDHIDNEYSEYLGII